ncbi:hypothetical protein BDP27DRAFT_1373938 [Rhodocollybia butyracea]|uniref:Uncharacterized protein n=1 Tax=Rhodocollybia butyracea TaxID=206335 RepID=A0A9P5P2L1_9AGAR|nr:hypothetical protein BDP27DRAFT_1373938 [Rhodocollybia butyracea]
MATRTTKTNEENQRNVNYPDTPYSAFTMTPGQDRFTHLNPVLSFGSITTSQLHGGFNTQGKQLGNCPRSLPAFLTHPPGLRLRDSSPRELERSFQHQYYTQELAGIPIQALPGQSNWESESRWVDQEDAHPRVQTDGEGRASEVIMYYPREQRRDTSGKDNATHKEKHLSESVQYNRLTITESEFADSPLAHSIPTNAPEFRNYTEGYREIMGQSPPAQNSKEDYTEASQHLLHTPVQRQQPPVPDTPLCLPMVQYLPSELPNIRAEFQELANCARTFLLSAGYKDIEGRTAVGWAQFLRRVYLLDKQMHPSLVIQFIKKPVNWRKLEQMIQELETPDF